MLGTPQENSARSMNFDFDLEASTGFSYSSIRTANPAEPSTEGTTDEDEQVVKLPSPDGRNSGCSAGEAQQGFPTHTAPETVEVFDPEYKFVYQVPRSLITHMPQQNKQITRLMWCKNFLPDVNGDPHHSSCPSRRHCKYVHVNVTSRDLLPHHSIHVNYIWRDPRECTYATMPPGERFIVCCSKKSSVTAYFHVPSERCLVTKGSREASSPSREVLYYCVEFHITGICREGDECPLVHVMTVDPAETQKYKRATHITFASLLKQFYQPRNRMEEREGEGRRLYALDVQAPQPARVIAAPTMQTNNEQFIGISQATAPSIMHSQFIVPQMPQFAPVAQLPIQYVQYVPPAQQQPLQWTMVLSPPQGPPSGAGSYMVPPPQQGTQFYQQYSTANPFNTYY